MAQLTSFGVGQTAKVVAVIYLFVGFIFAILWLPFMMFMGSYTGMGDSGFGMTGGILALIILPIVYAIAAWIATAIGCLIYNFVASKVGGVEINLEGGGVSGP